MHDTATVPTARGEGSEGSVSPTDRPDPPPAPAARRSADPSPAGSRLLDPATDARRGKLGLYPGCTRLGALRTGRERTEWIRPPVPDDPSGRHWMGRPAGSTSTTQTPPAAGSSSSAAAGVGGGLHPHGQGPDRVEAAGERECQDGGGAADRAPRQRPGPAALDTGRFELAGGGERVEGGGGHGQSSAPSSLAVTIAKVAKVIADWMPITRCRTRSPAFVASDSRSARVTVRAASATATAPACRGSTHAASRARAALATSSPEPTVPPASRAATLSIPNRGRICRSAVISSTSAAIPAHVPVPSRLPCLPAARIAVRAANQVESGVHRRAPAVCASGHRSDCGAGMESTPDEGTAVPRTAARAA